MQYIIETMITIRSSKANNAPIVIAAICASDKLFHAEMCNHICFITKNEHILITFLGK